MTKLDLTRVNIHRVQEWVADLRSGNFQQATGALFRKVRVGRTDDSYVSKYCCLGVACHTAVRKGAETITWNETNHRFNVQVGDDGLNPYFGMVLPIAAAEWFGFYTEDGAPVLDPPLDPDPHILASYVNDQLHGTFGEIADRIEKYIIEPARKAQGIS